MAKGTKKPFKETRVGKFLTSKGLNTALEIADDFIPGLDTFNDIKNLVLDKKPPFKTLDPYAAGELLSLIKLDIEEFKIATADTANARQREIELFKSGKKRDWFQHTTGVVALVLFLFVAGVIVFVDVPEHNKPLFHHLIGIIEGVIISIYTYYWGSSRGSKDKTEMIKKHLDERN